MEDYEKEYEEALKRLAETKEKVAAGDKTVDDLDEAIEEVRFLKKKRRMLREADHLIEQGSKVSIEEEADEEEPEEEFDFDAIDAELMNIIEKTKGRKSDDHAYIIGFKQGDNAMISINGKRIDLQAIFCALREQAPFRDIKPLDEKLHKAMMDFVKEIKE